MINDSLTPSNTKCKLIKDTSDISNTIEEIKALPLLEQKVLNHFFSLSSNYKSIYPSQTKIANKLGISREWCNKIIRKLIKKGYFVSNYRHMRSCEYLLAPFFFDVSVRAQLASLFKASLWFPLILLTVCQLSLATQKNSCNESQFTGLKLRKVYIYNNTLLFKPSKRERRTNYHFYENSEPISLLQQQEELRIAKEKIGLTKKGIAKLSVFNADTLNYANRVNLKHFKNPFDYFFRVCLQYAEQNGYIPNWSLGAQFGKVLDIPDEQPNYIPKKRLHPVFEGFIRKEEDAITKEQNLVRYRQNEATPSFEKLVGKNVAEDLTQHIHSPSLPVQDKPVEKKAPNQYWLNQFNIYKTQIVRTTNENG